VFTTPGFRGAVFVTNLVLPAWTIAFFFVTLFQDNPIARNWGALWYGHQLADLLHCCDPQISHQQEKEMACKRRFLAWCRVILISVLIRIIMGWVKIPKLINHRITIASTVHLYYMVK
jgi:hypothetical protein